MGCSDYPCSAAQVASSSEASAGRRYHYQVASHGPGEAAAASLNPGGLLCPCSAVPAPQWGSSHRGSQWGTGRLRVEPESAPGGSPSGRGPLVPSLSLRLGGSRRRRH